MANRLANATSPYLQQHAGNPVDWWEWGPEAFEEARRRDAPILLSVGYAACHWCHVMAHESFEDEQTASYLNEHFVPVKVDREERPDVDAVYMQATLAMTGQGGWPMTCVLDHEGTPFFAGTYFPQRPAHGMPSFRQVLEALADAWANRVEEVRGTAANIRQHLQRETVLSGTQPIDADVLDGAVARLASEFDPVNAGFGGAPKFPPSMVLEFLLRHHARVSTGSTAGDGGQETAGDGRALEMVARTCEAMARGGIYDQLGGGFARYSVDAGWVVPHFEKMLYDNAQLIGVYTDWWALTHEPLAERVVRDTVEFARRELWVPTGPARSVGGFASALDADSEGVEGRFYVWTPEQLREVLGEEDAAWAAERYAVTPAGTFEDGASTLQRPTDPAPQELDRHVRVWERLFHAREQRVRPARDDKVVTAWNGLMVSSLTRAAMVFGEDRWLDLARRTLAFLWDRHWVDERLRRASRDGVAGEPAGVLEDYACLAEAFLTLAEATGSAGDLACAGQLLAVANAEFAAPDGGFYDTAADAEQLLVRPRDPSDNASPSGQSAMIHALMRYAALTGSARHREIAERALATVRPLAEQAPRFAGWSLAAAESMLDGPREIVVVAEAGDPVGTEMARHARAVPGAVSLVVTPEEVGPDIPLLEGRSLVDGRATAYVCRRMVCQRPVTTVEELRAQLSAQ
ncbi:MAG TPA: thioredoxin domain-containing protein [Marmoricola sp.]|nr:thioredoxin domain-containing protein [Marmoricola sp.]